MITKIFEQTVPIDDNNFILSTDIINTQQIQSDSIECILSHSYFTVIFLHDRRSIKTRNSLKEWENYLSGNNFLRVNRTTIINLDFVKHIEKGTEQKLIIHMKNYEIPVIMSKNYIAKLKSDLFP
jgi:DNA-binding LytR/AlgR family response regulator